MYLRSFGLLRVAAVADGRLAQPAALEHRIDRHAHVLDPVERVEDAEQIDAGGRRLLHEVAHHVVGIVGVADRIGRAQQHLQQQIRHRLAQRRQPLPRILLQEPHRDVEGRAAPAFDREQLRQQRRIGRRDRHHVDGAHARRQQRLMRIAHRGIGQQHALLAAHPLREALRAELIEPLLAAGRARCRARSAPAAGAAAAPASGAPARPADDFGVAVDHGLRQEGQDARGAVAARRRRKQLRRLIDEARRVLRRARSAGA